MRGLNWKVGLVVSLLALALSAAAASAEVLGKTTGSLDATDARVSECSLGNLVADVARTALGADAAFVQASQLRPVDIPEGDLTREALAGALLYPDENVVLVELSGEQIRSALERSLSMLPKPNTGFLQVSGMHVTYRSAAVDARVAEVKIAGAALVASKAYKIAMPASLAKGALGYFRIFGNLEAKQGPPIGQATADFVLAMGTIAPQTGRLRDLSKPRG
jgi:2',3'-cyclic-nucleotide 2'-phosphodiesterase (5'-nucleotidase family)